MLPTRTLLLSTTAAVAVAGTALLVAPDSGQDGLERPKVAQVVFTSDRDGDNELFLLDGEGSITQLTDNASDDHGGEWSPDGKRIAFVSDRDGDPEIFVMTATGGVVEQLTDNDAAPDGARAADAEPAWSPDGRRIAFTSTRDGGEAEIYVMNADGTDQRRVTTTEAYVADNGPDWSPDGRELAFTSNRVGYDNVEIYRMRADGSDVERVTTTEAGIDDNAPAWSPDGTTIAFSSNRSGTHDLYTMKPDGSEQRLVTSDRLLDDVFPRWTRGGDALLFWTFSHPSGRTSAVWSVGADGAGRKLLLSGSTSHDSSPDAADR